MAFCPKCGKEVSTGSAFCPSCGAQLQVGSAQPQAPGSGGDALSQHAGSQMYWCRRVVAFVLCAIVLYAAIAVLSLLAAFPIFVLSGMEAAAALFGGVFSVLGGLVLMFYFAISEVTTGGSFGKHIMGLKVTAGQGRYPNFAEALVRNISKLYWVLLLLDVVVGLATSKEYTQKFSDRYMGTAVVSR